jgi:hypothetical protein
MAGPRRELPIQKRLQTETVTDEAYPSMPEHHRKRK